MLSQNHFFYSARLRRVIAFFLVIVFLFSDYAFLPASFAQTLRATGAGNLSASNFVPMKLAFSESWGKVDETFKGASQKTLILIQDAHDSLEAQENIAHLVDYFVREKKVHTVYEEGLEGKVPTDDYFGFIRNSDVKREVAYYLMDHLRVGGAEYAHINRHRPFNLVGIDNHKLHEQNLFWFRRVFQNSDVIQNDLRLLKKRLQKIADKKLNKKIKSWLKGYERYHRGEMAFYDFLRPSVDALGKQPFPSKQFPQIQILREPSDLAQIKTPELFKEVESFDSWMLEALGHNADEKELLRLFRQVMLFEKLSTFKLTPHEFKWAQEVLRSFNTQAAAKFIHRASNQSVVLSTVWESYLRDALQFYETAYARDEAVEQNLANGFLNDKENEAVLVFGGFHKDAIKNILQRHGISYAVISPKISGVSKRHQAYYQEIMAHGYLKSELPQALARATVQNHVFQITSREGFPAYLRRVLPPRLSSLLPLTIARSEQRDNGIERVDYPDSHLRIAMAQINTTVGDFEGNYRKALASYEKARTQDVDVLVLPELTISGYLPEDLVNKEHFVRQNKETLHLFAKQIQDMTVVIGFIDSDDQGNLYNAAAVISDGEVKHVYHKWDLPNYGVFDEKRNFTGKETTIFTPGHTPFVFTVKGLPVGLNICEDIWNDRGRGLNVYEEEAKLGAKLQINISASPFHEQKLDQVRLDLLRKRAAQTGSIILYANLVGGQDEVVFDGGSMIMTPQGELTARGAQFQEDLVITDVDLSRSNNQPHADALFPAMSPSQNSSRKVPLEKRELTPPLSAIAEDYEAMVLATRDYLRKSGFKTVVLGLSGGIDSAVVAAIARDAIGAENVKGISMPTQFNSEGTKSDARITAEKLGIKFEENPIQNLFSLFLSTVEGNAKTGFVATFYAFLRWFSMMPKFGHWFQRFSLVGFSAFGISEENMQARIRGMMLMRESNKNGSLLLTTGNKSETAVGYATLYGDMAGGFAPIKDAYKTRVFDFARYVNQRDAREVIPVSTIDRPPSAELNKDQKDEDALPPYVTELDPMLKLYLEKNAPAEDLAVVAGMKQALTEKGIYSEEKHRLFADEVFTTGNLIQALAKLRAQLGNPNDEPFSSLKERAAELGSKKAHDVIRRVDLNEYKRRQGPPGVKLTPTAFGKDRRMPIVNTYRQRGVEDFLRRDGAPRAVTVKKEDAALIVGKFAPFHNGHESLIRQALNENEKVVVLVYDHPELINISATEMAEMITKIINNERLTVIPVYGAPPAGDSREARQAHLDFMKRQLPPNIHVTKVYNNEWYGKDIANGLNAEIIQPDPKRTQIGISAKKIRQDPTSLAEAHVHPDMWERLQKSGTKMWAVPDQERLYREGMDASFVDRSMDEAEKVRIRASIEAKNPGYADKAKLFAPVKWDPATYESENLPSVVGNLRDHATFSQQRGVRILDLLIRDPKKGWAIPKVLEPFREAIQMAVEHERAINPDFDELHVYVTIDQKKVEPDKFQRRPGGHADAFPTKETNNISSELVLDDTYIMSDRPEISTWLMPGPFPVKDVDLNDDEAVLKRFDEVGQKQIAAGKAKQMPAFQMIRMTPYDIHAVAQNKTGHPIERTFIKVQFSRDRLNMMGNTLNRVEDKKGTPVFDYSDWTWIPRKQGVRNNRNSILGWNRADADQFLEVDPSKIDFNQGKVAFDWAEPEVLFIKKIEGVHAEPAIEGEVLETKVNGDIVTFNIAQKGDRKITTSQGDQYFLSDEKFRDRYFADEGKDGFYQPQAQVARAIRIIKPIRIRSSWGAWQYLSVGSVLVSTHADHAYGIHKDNYEASYRRTDAEGNFLSEQLLNPDQVVSADVSPALKGQIESLNPAHSTDNLFGVAKWDVAGFNEPHLPVVISDTLSNRDNVSYFEGDTGIRYLDLLIYAPGQGWAIPKNLEPFIEPIRLAYEAERLANPAFKERFIHITVDQKTVPIDKPGRRPGLHADAGLKDANGRSIDVLAENRREIEAMRGKSSDHAYVFYDKLPTEFYPGPFHLEQAADGATFESLVPPGQTPVTYPKFTLLRLNAFDVHTSTINQTGESQKRTFFKLQFTERLLDRPNNSINSFLNYDRARAVSVQRSEQRSNMSREDALANIARLNAARPKGYPERSLNLTKPYTAPIVYKNARSKKNPYGWAHPDLSDSKISAADRHRAIETLRAHIMRFDEQFDLRTDFDPETGLPVNDAETGLNGRGSLGRHGPNPAEDAIFLRYNKAGELEVLVIERNDGGGRALPGGMIKEGEENLVGVTSTRELEEETKLQIDMTKGVVVFRGKANEWRDTNDAWMVTRGVAVLLSWEESQHLKPHAGSDAKKKTARFVKVTDNMGLYAHHQINVNNAVAMVRNGQLQTSDEAINKNIPAVDITITDIEEAYELFKAGKGKVSESYDLIVPETPHGGGYAVFAGLEETLSSIRRRRFTPDHIAALRKMETFSEDFLKFLQQFTFEGDLDALPEGSVVSPKIPLMRIQATPVEMALLKGLIQNRIGFSTNIATKTARITQAANGDFVTPEAMERLRKKDGLAPEQVKKIRPVSDFGQRRGQGKGSLVASLAAIIGGAISTSFVKAAKQFFLNASGTMAHLFISSFPAKLEIMAFRIWGKIYPKTSIFLLDTYDSIEATKKAIIVAKEMVLNGGQLFGVRLDSGDLVVLSRTIRKMLDDADLHYVKIFATDDLDEFKITDILSKGARIDGFGVGTNLITGGKQATLKLEFVPSHGERYWRARHQGQFTRYVRTDRDRVAHASYGEEMTELLRPFWRKGQRVQDAKKPWKAHERAIDELRQFKPENKKLENAATIPVEDQKNPLTINPETDAIISIDATKAFMKKGGLPVKDGDDVVAPIKLLLRRFPKNRRFAAVDKHPRGHISWASSFVGTPPMTYLTYEEVEKWTDANHKIGPNAKFDLAQLKEKLKRIGGQMLWPDHAGENTPESELHPDFLESDFEYIEVKGMDPATDSYSAFFDNDGNPTKLAQELRKRGIKRVFVMGLAYDYCVGWSAEGAHKLGFEVVVVKDGTRPVGFPADSISKMDASFAAKEIPVVSTQDVLDANDYRGVNMAKMLETPIAHPDFPEEEDSSALEEDMYHITMGQTLFLENLHNQPATFDYFYRAAPYGQDHITVSGLRFLLEELKKFRFTEEQIQYLANIHKLSSASELDPKYVAYLRNYRFQGDISGLPEGSVAYPNEPILTVKGTLFDTMIIETLILKTMNFGGLISTWASLERQQKGNNARLIATGLEGAHGIAHSRAAYAAFIAGIDATDDFDAAMRYGIPLAGPRQKGTRLGADLLTGGPKSSMGGVYKLVHINKRGVVKLSENAAKTSLPGNKVIVEVVDKTTGKVLRRLKKLQSEKLELAANEKIRVRSIPLVHKGEAIYSVPDPFEVRAYRDADAARLKDIKASEVSPRMAAFQKKLIDRIHGRSEQRKPHPNVQESELSEGEVDQLYAFSKSMMEQARSILDEFIVRGFGQSKKDDGSVLTDIDPAIQQRVLEMVRERFPAHYVLAEEKLTSAEARENDALKNSDYKWVVDPIDGSRILGEGNNYYAISIALYFKGKPVLGLVYSPFLGGFLETSQNEPHVTLNHMPIVLDPKAALPKTLKTIIPGTTPYSENFREALLDDTRLRQAGVQKIETQVVIRSAVVNLANILRSRYDLFANIGEKEMNIWDIAAAGYLLQKAGRSMLVSRGGKWENALEVFRHDLTSTQTMSGYHFIAGSDAVLAHVQAILSPSGTPVNSSQLPRDVETVSNRVISHDKPFAAVFDFHGTLVETTWKNEFALAYDQVKKVGMAAALAWVEKNAHQDLRVFMPAQLGMKQSEFLKILAVAQEESRENYFPRLLDGAREMVQALLERNVPVFILTGSPSEVVLKQLEQAGLLDLIPKENIITRDRIEQSTGKVQGSLKDAAISSLQTQLPNHRFLHFSDSPGGFESIHQIEGFNFGRVDGEGQERVAKRERMVGSQADFLLNAGFKHWRELIDFLKIKTALQYQAPVLATTSDEAVEVPFILPAKRNGGLALHIFVSDDLKEVTYSEVLDDSQVYGKEGAVDYTKLKLKKIATFPSSYLISPSKQIAVLSPPEVLDAIGRVWPQHKRYTTYRGVTTSWDQEEDINVWSFNIDSGYLLKVLHEAGLLNETVKKAAEVGVGGGQVSADIVAALPHLEEMTFSDISLYALRAAKANILPWIKKKLIRLRTFLGKGIKAFPKDLDLLIVNPPYIPTSPFEKRPTNDPYRGTGLIHEVIQDGFRHLNPANPKAAVVMNVSSLAAQDFERYQQEFSAQVEISPIGEPLLVPLKIRTISEEWKRWLVENGMLERRPTTKLGEEEYWHRIQAYVIRPKANVRSEQRLADSQPVTIFQSKPVRASAVEGVFVAPITVLVDARDFAAFNSEQKQEFFKLFEKYQGQQHLKFIFENIAALNEQDPVAAELRDFAGQYPRLIETRNQSLDRLALPKTAVIMVSKEGLDNAARESMIRSSVPQHLIVSYKRQNISAGLITAALLLFQSERYQAYQNRSLSEVPSDLQAQVFEILESFVYIGRSA